jgi:hypothetical protein
MVRQDNDLLTTGMVARWLARAEETVRGYVRSGRLPAIRTVTGIRLYRRIDVSRLAEELRARELSK